MTRTKKFLYGVGWGYVNQFVMAAAGLYLTRFYLGALGKSFYGLWIVGLQILAYLTLLDLGLVALLPRETAYALGGNRGRLPALIAETVSLSSAQAPLLALLSLVAWFWLPVEWATLKGPLAFTFAAFVFSFPLRTYPAVLQGLQDFSFLGKAHFITWALGTVASVAGLWAGLGLYALAAGWIVTQGTLFLSCYVRLRSEFASDLPTRIALPTWALAKARFAKSGWITLSQVSQVLLVGTDVLVLGKLLGPGTVVVYACTSKLVQLLVNQPLTLTQSALPGLSELKSSQDLGAIRRVSESLTLLVMLVSGAIVAVVLAVNGGFVRWWVGTEQYGGNALTLLLVLNMTVRHYATTLVFSLFCFGHEKALALIGIADGVLTLGLSLLLTPRFGMLGPVIASLLGAVTLSIPLVARYLAHDLRLSFFGMLRPLVAWTWRMTALGAVAAMVLWGRPPRGPLEVGAVTAVMATIYALLMLPIVKRSSLLLYAQPVWDRTVGLALRRAK